MQIKLRWLKCRNFGLVDFGCVRSSSRDCMYVNRVENKAFEVHKWFQHERGEQFDDVVEGENI